MPDLVVKSIKCDLHSPEYSSTVIRQSPHWPRLHFSVQTIRMYVFVVDPNRLPCYTGYFYRLSFFPRLWGPVGSGRCMTSFVWGDSLRTFQSPSFLIPICYNLGDTPTLLFLSYRCPKPRILLRWPLNPKDNDKGRSLTPVSSERVETFEDSLLRIFYRRNSTKKL